VAAVPQDLRSVQSVKLVNGCPFPPAPRHLSPSAESHHLQLHCPVVVIKNAQVVKSQKTKGKTGKLLPLRTDRESRSLRVCLGRNAPED